MQYISVIYIICRSHLFFGWEFIYLSITLHARWDYLTRFIALEDKWLKALIKEMGIQDEGHSMPTQWRWLLDHLRISWNLEIIFGIWNWPLSIFFNKNPNNLRFLCRVKIFIKSVTGCKLNKRRHSDVYISWNTSPTLFQMFLLIGENAEYAGKQATVVLLMTS